ELEYVDAPPLGQIVENALEYLQQPADNGDDPRQDDPPDDPAYISLEWLFQEEDSLIWMNLHHIILVLWVSYVHIVKLYILMLKSSPILPYTIPSLACAAYKAKLICPDLKMLHQNC
ncbi:hypothetical protein C0995_003690, partial [Termitomyces sp. Mi166